MFLALSRKHVVTVEYALSAENMIEAVTLARPDLIVCPFLTTMVPKQIYGENLTLIVHPGPPGDAGPSALDWLLMGDDGTEANSDVLLQRDAFGRNGRTHWGVTVLQATEEFDAGPVWAFDQFPVNINDSRVTKSTLYRGPVTSAAVTATLAAVNRIEAADALSSFVIDEPMSDPLSPPASPDSGKANEFITRRIRPTLATRPEFATQCVSAGEPFLGGKTRHRPLLKAAQRDFSIKRHPAADISRRIRSADSQPGCLSTVFGPKLYLYGGIVENPTLLGFAGSHIAPGTIIATRDEAVCIATCDNRGVWITHIRRLKVKTDTTMWPKVPAASGLKQLGVDIHDTSSWCQSLLPQTMPMAWSRSYHGTFQEVWVDFASDGTKRLAYLYFDFYNGAMSTDQCQRLLQCFDYILATASDDSQCLPLAAVILMGGSSYFSNGIHLNVIEAAQDPALESWYNINAINDVVQKLLDDLPSRGVATVAAIRGNCAAGGVALAAACDVVLAGKNVVLNPAYRGLGLFGSEFHTLSYPGRCGRNGAAAALRSMTPLSATDARSMGLVDAVLPYSGDLLEGAIKAHASELFRPWKTGRHDVVALSNIWKRAVEISPATLARARATELGQMSMDFWSPRSERYHCRRQDFVLKAKPVSTPLRFATHRRTEGLLDEEERDDFDSVEWFAEKKVRDMTAAISSKMIRLISDISSIGGRTQQDIAGKKLASDRQAQAPIAGDVSTPLFSCYYNS